VPEFPAAGDQFGPYRIVREIGRGGMGAVFVAVQESLGRDVALKVLLPQFASDVEFRDRFNREATTLARLDSLHVVRVYDHGEVEGCLYIASQLVTGGDLAALVEREGSLDPRTALDIASQVTDALADAHAVGVFHRDVKAKNVLVREGRELWVFLCDFGIAWLSGQELTRTGSVLGSFAVMAPERFRGAPASAATDVYAVGCLIWHMLTGGPPYRGTELELPLQHVSEPIPQLPATGPVNAALNELLLRTMAKDPADRYPDTAALGRALRAARAIAEAPVDDTEASPTLLRRQVPPPVAPPSDEGARTRPEFVPSAYGRRPRSGIWVSVAAAAVVVLLGVGGVAAWALGHGRSGSSGVLTVPSGARIVGGVENGRPVAIALGEVGGSYRIQVRDASASGRSGALLDSLDLGRWSGDPGTFVGGDFNGDGETDVAWSEQLFRGGSASGLRLQVALGNGAGGLRAAQVWGTVPNWVVADMKVIVGDFTGDGADDYAEFGKTHTGGVDIQVLASNGADAFAAPRRWSSEPGYVWSYLLVTAGRFTGQPVDDALEVGLPHGSADYFQIDCQIFRNTGDTLERGPGRSKDTASCAEPWDWRTLALTSASLTGDAGTDQLVLARPEDGRIVVSVLARSGPRWLSEAMSASVPATDSATSDVFRIPGAASGRDAIGLVVWEDGRGRLVRLDPTADGRLVVSSRTPVGWEKG